MIPVPEPMVAPAEAKPVVTTPPNPVKPKPSAVKKPLAKVIKPNSQSSAKKLTAPGKKSAVKGSACVEIGRQEQSSEQDQTGQIQRYQEDELIDGR